MNILIKASIHTALILIIVGMTQLAHASLLMKPTYHPDLDYQAPILEGTYNQNVTHPDEILGFELGYRVAKPAYITQAIHIWKEQSNRMKVLEYARSHEGALR